MLLRVSSTLQKVGILPTLVYFLFLGWKWSEVRVPIGCSSPTRTMLLLGEDMRLPYEERGLHLGEGSVRLGEGSVILGEGSVRLVEGLHLGKGMFA